MGVIGALVALAVVAGLVWFLWYTFHGTSSDVASVVWSDPAQRTELVGRDAAGAIKWSHRLPAAAERFTTIEGVIYLPEFENPQVEDVILSFDPSVGLRWQKTVREVIGPIAERFPTDWTATHNLRFTADGVRRTVILFDHRREWPSVLVVLDDSGAVLGRFTHAGHLTSLALEELPESRATWAKSLLISSGTNAHGALVLAAFDALNVAGASPEEARSKYQCAECGAPGQGVRLYEFPRTEVEIAGNLPVENFSSMRTSDDYAQRMTYMFGGRVSWYFSEDFERARLVLGDDYWRRHEELEASGRIKHTRANCPEPRGPKTIRAWRPDGGWRELALEP